MAAVFPLPRYDPRNPSQSVNIERPVEIASFSFDDNHEYHLDESSLKYYHPPTLPVDLKDGFTTFHKYEQLTDAHLDGLLDTLIAKEKEHGTKARADFITWRGMMTKIMTAPFDPYSEFNMRATLFDGVIFIEEDFAQGLQDRAQEATRPPGPNGISHDMMTYWGYKFETLSVIPDTREKVSRGYIERRPTLPVSNYAQFCSIVRTGFGTDLRVVLGGEVDAIMAPKANPVPADTSIPYVELKTAENAPLNNERAMRKWEFKLLRFWAQSYLLGVPKIVVGLRSPQGELRALEEYNTLEIPGGVARNGRSWDKNHCVRFSAQFLKFLKDTIREEGGVWTIRKAKREKVIKVEKVEGVEGFEGIVSERFVSWRREMNAGKGAG